MELTWLESLIYGLISGFAEFLPISAVAHQTILKYSLGIDSNPLVQCAVYAGCAAAAILICLPSLQRLFRARRLSANAGKNRRKLVNIPAVTELRLLRIAVWIMAVMFLGHGFVNHLSQRLWILALLLTVNGIVLFVPQHLPGANKGPQSMSSLDGLLIGIAAGFGIIPGISRMGSAVSTALLRGADKRFALEIGLLLSVPALILLLIIQVLTAVSLGVVLTGSTLLAMVIAAAASFVAAYFGIILMRFLAFRLGFSGFAYYCWGAAMITVIIYLI